MVSCATQTPSAEARLPTIRDSVGVIMVGEATELIVLVSLTKATLIAALPS